MDKIDLEKLQNTPVYEVLRDYLTINKMNIQNVDALDNYYNILERLKKCIEESDFRLGGKLVRFAELMLRIESEKLLIKYMDDDARDRYLMNNSKWYHMEVQAAIDDAVLAMLSRHKDKIFIDQSEMPEKETSLLGLSDLNRRRDVTEEDFRNIMDDEIAFEDLMRERRESEHFMQEALSTSMVEGFFDMDLIMDNMRSKLRPGIEEDISNLGMEYIDAFMAALHLHTLGEINIRQREFGAPIFIRQCN